jgi:ABC-type polar amino acid transport system ATPase subunit
MISVRGLVKRRGSLAVLRGIDLDVSRNDVACFIGPSGCGKTTLLRCMNGLESFDEGSIRVNGATLRAGIPSRGEAARLRAVRARVGMVFQQFHLFPHRTAIQNVMEGPIHVAGRPRAEARALAESLLERVGLASKADRMPDTLSGGEQQRVAIARALAMEPEVVLFDEPTSALDPRMTSEVLSVISDLARSGQTMVVVTHLLDFARHLGGTIHFIDEGRVIESGPAARVLDQPMEEATRRFLRTVGPCHLPR